MKVTFVGRLREEDVQLLLQQIFEQTFIKGTETDPQCKCGQVIREHPNPPVPVGATGNLSDVDGIMKFGMQQKYPFHKFFNPCSDTTETIPREVKPQMRDSMGNRCCVCGRTDEVSIAHLLKQSENVQRGQGKMGLRRGFIQFSAFVWN